MRNEMGMRVKGYIVDENTGHWIAADHAKFVSLKSLEQAEILIGEGVDIDNREKMVAITRVLGKNIQHDA